MGIVTLVCDTLKGFLPPWLAMRFGLCGPTVAAIGLAAFAGHLFSVYLGFRGGKGIATALGVFIAFSWPAVLIDLAVFAIVLGKWRYVSLGSLVCTALMPILLLVLRAPMPYTILSVAMAVLIFIKHRANIRRLLAGKENRIGVRSNCFPELLSLSRPQVVFHHDLADSLGSAKKTLPRLRFARTDANSLK